MNRLPMAAPTATPMGPTDGHTDGPASYCHADGPTSD